MEKRTFVDITCKLWCNETDWFKHMCHDEFGTYAIDANKYADPRERTVLGCNTMWVRGLKQNIDNLCKAIKERDYDIDITYYKEFEG